MESKKNQMLLGLIVCIIGLSTIFFNSSRFMLVDLLLLGAGAACLLLYMTKKKSWSLIIGAYLFYFGAYRLLNMFFGGMLSGNIFVAMFFIVPGLIFFILYYDKNKYGLIIPASLLLWFGLFILAMGIPFINRMGGMCFFLFMGMGFMTIRVASKGFIGKWPVYTALIFFCVSGLTMLGEVSSFAGSYGRPMVSAAIIIFGLVIIFKSIREKSKK